MAEKVHDINVKKPQIKVGDVVKLQDKVPTDVRIAINEAARLGEAYQLDAEARLLEAFAKSKREQHTARVILDQNPNIIASALPTGPRPWLNFAVLGVVIAILLLTLGQVGRKDRSPTLPNQNAAIEASVAPIPTTLEPSKQQGRVGR